MKNIKDDKREQIKLEKRLRKMQKSPHVAVGILQDKPVSKELTMVDLATVHEYGSKDGRIPKRSFMRKTFDTRRKRYIQFIAKLQNRYINGKLTMHQALTQLGEIVSKDIVATINRGIKPKLKPATIKRKKSSKPLINHGVLKGEITHQVRGAS